MAPGRIIIAEDDEGDIALMRIILRDSGLAHDIKFLRDGEETVNYLWKDEIRVPELILLDLKLPKMTGLEVLRKIRSDNSMHSIPVVIFSSSSDQGERTECFAQGATDVIVKPIDFEAFRRALVGIIEKYLPAP